MVQHVPSKAQPYLEVFCLVKQSFKELVGKLYIALIYFKINVAFPEVLRLIQWHSKTFATFSR
jgi:hypothetical protein